MREGGQKFTDEIIYAPGTVVTRQGAPNASRLRFENPDLGRTTGRATDNVTPVRGGRVVLEKPGGGPVHAERTVVTQFPQ